MSGLGPANRIAIVIGCGVAGPAVSIALRRAGFDVALHEAWPTADDTAGGWLTVMPNGLGVLRTLGVEAALFDDAFACERIEFHDHTSRTLAVLPTAGAAAVRRGTLHRVLRERVVEQGVDISFGKRLVDVHELGATVVAHFEDGTSAAGDLLVGCDGLHSRVREVTMPEAPRFDYVGTVSNIGFCRTTTLPPTTGSIQMIFGRRSSFRYLVRESGEVFWAGDTAVPPEPGRTEPPDAPDEYWRQRLVADFAGDVSPALELITSTTTIARQPVYRLGDLANWHRGRVCLVGDAAHAIPPYAGQGASMALEDAVTLAKCLRDVPDVTEALAAYQRIRRPRQARVAAQVRVNHRLLGARGPVGRWIRSRMIPIGLRRSVAAGQWIHSYAIDWDEPVGTGL